jgi:hypothetical protein
MKTALFAFFFLCATACFGQVANSTSSSPQPIAVPDHPQHASEHALAQESSLLSTSSYTYAQGERPLSDFPGTLKPETPLGDIARAFRKQRTTTDAKSPKVVEN